MTLLLWTWAAWAMLHLLLATVWCGWFALLPLRSIGGGVYVAPSPARAAFVIGRTVVVTSALRAALEPDELAAVIAHERGHVAHRHTLQRLAWAVLLFAPSGWMAHRHEFEADAYAARVAGADALARALRKLPHPQNSRSHPALAERLAAIGVDSLH